MPEDYRDNASQLELASFESLEQVSLPPLRQMVDVVVDKIPSWLITILKRPESEWQTFEKRFVKHAEDTGLLPVMVWWYPSSWAVSQKCYWKYLVEAQKFSQLEYLIELRLERYQTVKVSS